MKNVTQSKSRIPRQKLSMEEYDNLPPRVRKILANAHHNSGISQEAAKLPSSFLIERAYEFSLRLAIDAYGPDYPLETVSRIA